MKERIIQDHWCASHASAYLRLDDVGKSPWQLLGHCASMVPASRAGIDSAWSIASESADDPTVIQINDVMKLFMIASFALQL
jgi:hypothetical protein